MITGTIVGVLPPGAVREAVTDLLAERGHDHWLHVVDGVAAALPLLADHPEPEVVLLWRDLPVVDDDPEVRALLDHPADVPVVALVARHDDVAEVCLVGAGVQDALALDEMTAGALVRSLHHAVERHRLLREVRERRKEVAGLFRIGRALQHDVPVPQACAAVAQHLAASMRWPALATALVEVDGVVGHGGADGPVATPTLRAAVVVEGSERGSVEVGYVEPDHGFLDPDEQYLVDAVAESLAGWVVRQDVLARLVHDEERLRLLVDQLPGSIWSVDRDLRVTSYAGAALRQLQETDDRLLGRPLLRVLRLEDDDEVGHHVRRALEGTSAVFDREWGGRWWRNHVGPVRDGRGAIVGAVCLSLDATDEHRATDALAGSEERFRAIAESAQDGIYQVRWDPGPRMDYLNPAMEQITGFTVRRLVDDPGLFRSRVHRDDRDQLGQHAEPGETALVRFERADGRLAWLEIARSPLLEHGRTVGALGLVRDVTAREEAALALRDALAAEQHAVERLEALDALKSSFLQAVSHELRTPLTSLLGYARTLVDHGDRLEPERVTAFHRRMAANADRLERLLVDLLDVERLNQGVVRLDARPTDLRVLVAEVVGRLDLDERAVVLDDTPATARVDAPKVERVVENLVGNALKHTPDDCTVWVEQRVDGDGRATIVVSDDGPGIPEDERGEAFAPFWQGRDARGEPSPGTGIGLALVHRLVLLHGGEVTADERPGGGARFTVVLPPGDAQAHDVPADGTAGSR